MTKSTILATLALGMLLGTCAAHAGNTVLSGVFDGSEPQTAGLPGTCPWLEDDLRYQVITQVQVTASGTYWVADAYNVGDGDVTALIYSSAFNPASPSSNLLTTNGVDVWESVNLSSGTNYVLVVQHWCENAEGAWAVTFSGPGTVTSSSVVTVPDWTSGMFAGGDPMADTDCGNSQYHQTGPVQVARTGTYYYSDVSLYSDVDMCLQVYSAPFSPGSPGTNRVGDPMDDYGTVELQAGNDYWFVAQPLIAPSNGGYFFVLAPPAPFRITHAMAGSWYDPPTSGQGFFMDVFDDSNQLFLAWFTYDLERPDPSATALIGEPGHRWMTALGPFSGDTASLNIYWNSGMVFDSADPPVQGPVQDGSMTVEFFDCSTGQVTYDLGTSDVVGQVPIQRLANDAVPLCEHLLEGPGQPGPL